MTKSELQTRVDARIGASVAAKRLSRPRRLTQAQVAQMTQGQLTRSAIANIENGRQRVAVYHLYALARALGVAPSDLLPPMNEIFTKEEKTETQRKVLEKLIPRSRGGS